MTVVRACATCGVSVKVFPSRSLIKKYCSYTCFAEARRGKPNGRAYPASQTCSQCGANYKGQGAKYCTPTCAYEAARKRHERSCETCGVLFSPRNRRTAARYCSRSCTGIAKRLDKGAGPVGRDGYRGANWPETAAAIRARDNDTCRNCGRRWAIGEKRFPVDHMVPWRWFESLEQANDPANLATLCPSCHSRKTHGIERRAVKGDWTHLTKWRSAIEAN